MSLILDYIKRHPKETKRLIGITYEQLQQLWQQAEILHNQKKAEAEQSKVRINVKGAGCKSKLNVLDQILLTLVYLSQLHTFQYLGIEFEVSESTAHNIFRYWLPLLEELLPASLLEQTKKNDSEKEVIKELLVEYELIVDSAEQPIERPTEYEAQKKFYSGKKKNHTRKNQFIVMPKGSDIVDVKVGATGPSSDINLFREQQRKFNPNQKFKGDKAYIGASRTTTPHKKPKKQELSLEQKEENKKISANRIFVEHLIRLVKIFRVAAERFRLRRSTYEQVILTVCGLVRLRIGALIFPN